MNCIDYHIHVILYIIININFNRTKDFILFIHLEFDFRVEGLTVLLGALDLTNSDVPAGQVMVSVKAAGITLHPDYSASTYHNDIAIISLGQVVQLSSM